MGYKWCIYNAIDGYLCYEGTDIPRQYAYETAQIICDALNAASYLKNKDNANANINTRLYTISLLTDYEYERLRRYEKEEQDYERTAV